MKMRKGFICRVASDMVSKVEDVIRENATFQITAKQDVFDSDAVDLRIECDALSDDFGVAPGGQFRRVEVGFNDDGVFYVVVD